VDGLSVYERLAAINPSPYHFWYAGPRFEVVGASPEPCLTLHDGRALIRPLAGTRPRGHDSLADQLAEDDLRSSVKEMAEHRMLVDLARNDLGRVCRPGSVSVERLMAVERYSHVMHLTSDVRGRTRGDRGTDELLRATFPAGTMTGTPKVRAMEIIDDLEPSRRWLYSGAVGSFGLSHVDLYLTIRSMVLCDGEIRLQAGGGIVHDSEPPAEYAECLAKLGSGARALGVTVEGAAA
jgi:anthranilate synthase component I